MAALIVEDGTSPAGANTYAAATDAAGYAAINGVALPDDCSGLLLQAMRYIEALERRWQGIRTGNSVFPQVAQPLSWPRSRVWLNGTAWPSNVIPSQLIDAQCQLVCDLANGAVLQPTSSVAGNIKRKTVGPLTTEYFAPNAGASILPTLTAARAFLLPLFNNSGTGVTRV